VLVDFAVYNPMLDLVCQVLLCTVLLVLLCTVRALCMSRNLGRMKKYLIAR
jgi:hypothetical protein